jgi:putative hydrolase of the HAD superfamily
MLPVLIFDMDDTLYLERDFVRSGFKAAGAWLERETGVPDLAPVCQSLFEEGQRTRIFDAALAKLGLPPEQGLVDVLVKIYRTHEPDIALAADADAYLRSRPTEFAGGLITDGPHCTQRAKARALGLEQRLEFIVYTDALGAEYGKPHARAFELVEAWAPPAEHPLVYVADNPAKDFVTPRARGWWTVQIVRPERVHRTTAPSAAHQPHARITSLTELDDCLSRLAAAVPSMATRASRHAPSRRTALAPNPGLRPATKPLGSGLS